MSPIHVMRIYVHSRHFFRESIKVWQKVFPAVIDSQLQIAAWLAH